MRLSALKSEAEFSDNACSISSGECLGIVDGCLDLGVRPLETSRDGGDIFFFIAANKEQHLPYCKRASLDVSLPTSRGVPKVDESEFRASEAFLY